MHELVQDVLPFLVAFFVADSLAIARAHEWLLLSSGGAFRLLTSGLPLLGLSPFAEAIGAFDPPVRFTPAGLLLIATGERVPYDKATDVRAEERVLRFGSAAVKLPSAAAARGLASQVREVRDADPARRRERLEAKTAEATDVMALRVLRDRERPHRRALQWLGLGQGLAIFLLLPAAVAVRSVGVLHPSSFLLLIGLLHVAILVVAGRALRARGDGSPIATGLLPIALFPPAGVHASFLVFRDGYARFDPLVVAGLLLPAADFRALARGQIHRLRRAAEPGSPEERAWAAVREKALTRALVALGTSLEAVMAPPERADASGASYCPLCGSEYRAGFTLCSECGVPLEALA
jgi:hypothetical protein